MKKLILFILLVLSAAMACKKDEFKIDRDNLLIGTWINTNSVYDTVVYSRIGKFTDSYCIRFNDDGSVLERRNSGFCGTPPITYADYNGSWRLINDTIMEVRSEYWGGITVNKYDIELLTTDSLKLIIISSNTMPF